uniref:UDP-D-xylose:beta-D-glucoside alpha-1,3-D-xylosyltransferase n=1 Tax=Ixodes ricinus TaxID=34613 RepID=A0A147BBX0_IXORI
MYAVNFWCRPASATFLVVANLVLLASLLYTNAPGARCRCADEKSPTVPPQANGSTTNRGPVTLVVITCGDRLELTTSNLKSAVAFSRAPLRLILYADVDNIKSLQDRIMQWPASFLARITYDLRLVAFPSKNFEKWKKLYEPCSTQRLFLPAILPDEDVVLYVDGDTLFLNPVEELWDVFGKMNESQLIAQAHASEDDSNSWYKLKAKVPYIPPFGVNTGVMPMNLTRMRNFGWVSRMELLLEEYEDQISLGDQDLVNILFSFHPDRLFLMTCRWNYRQRNCIFHASCSGETPALLHGNGDCATDPDVEPAIYAIFCVMKKYELGTSLERNFIDPLERELLRVRRSECFVQLMFHSKQWRILARQLDRERGFSDKAINATTSPSTST